MIYYSCVRRVEGLTRTHLVAPCPATTGASIQDVFTYYRRKCIEMKHIDETLMKPFD